MRSVVYTKGICSQVWELIKAKCHSIALLKELCQNYRLANLVQVYYDRDRNNLEIQAK